jgi:hypothetical protein
MAICIECGDNFAPGHKGYANKCYDCSFKRKPTEEQRRIWEEAENYFVNNDGERVYFDVVNRWNASELMS